MFRPINYIKLVELFKTRVRVSSLISHFAGLFLCLVDYVLCVELRIILSS
jgi:hypothetical protein